MSTTVRRSHSLITPRRVGNQVIFSVNGERIPFPRRRLLDTLDTGIKFPNEARTRECWSPSSVESGASGIEDNRRGPPSRSCLSRHAGVGPEATADPHDVAAGSRGPCQLVQLGASNHNNNNNGSNHTGGNNNHNSNSNNGEQAKPERQSSGGVGGGGGGGSGAGPMMSMMDRGGAMGVQMNPPSMAPMGPHGMSGLMQQQQQQPPQPPMYQPPAALYDDDPGIMSEVETSATGLRRGAKARSSLPIVRTPNKTNERPLGLVFLQYRNETRRALLPNEITSMDTVKALFVRSFPRQLSMEYLDSAIIRIYIHDPSRDMFYELEDLRDVRDRSVLRIYEHDPQSGAPIMFAAAPLPMHPAAVGGGGVGLAAQHGLPPDDLSYFSEPEFDSDYPNSHSMHRQQQQQQPPRGAQQVPPCPPPKGSSYYGIPMYANRGGGGPQPPMRPYSPAASERAMRTAGPPMGPPGPPPAQLGFSQTLPRGMTYSAVGVPIGIADDKRSQQPPHLVPMSQSHHDLNPKGRGYPHDMAPRSRTPEGYLSSPERSSRMMYPEPDQFFDPRLAQGPPGAPLIDEEARLRVEYMERQLASLTGLVHKALAPTSPNPALQAPGGVLQPPHTGAANLPASRPQHLIPTRDTDKDGGDFGPPGLPPALPDKESRHNKPLPPPKPATSTFTHNNKEVGSSLSPELCIQLRQLRRQSKELRTEVRSLRRLAQTQAVTTREAVKDTCAKINEAIARVKSSQEKEDREKEKEREELLQGSGDAGVAARERIRVSRQEGSYNVDAQTLEKDLAELETQVEELRSNVINRRCRVNMSNVESMALVLSKASRTVADLKNRFPALQETMKAVISGEMETVVREEKFLKEEPERLENALRRCKKLTGTLVTLKRLASVQEQRHTSLPEKSISADGSGLHSHSSSSSHSDGEPTQASQSRSSTGPSGLSGLSVGPGAPSTTRERRRSENALDALLDELQTFSPRSADSPSKRCLPVTEAIIGTGNSVGLSGDNRSKSTSALPLGASVATPAASSGNNSCTNSNSAAAVNGSSSASSKEVGAKKTPPPPPPRTTSKSPVQSPTGTGASSSTSVTNISVNSNNNSSSNNNNGNNENNNNNNSSSSSTSSSGNNNSNNSAQQQQQQQQQQQTARRCQSEPPSIRKISEQNSSGSSESVNSQEGTQNRQEMLEQRHQELLKKQKLLQEQYARLQLLQKLSPPKPDLKKTGSESNILHKASAHGASGICASHTSGSLTSLAASAGGPSNKITSSPSQPQLATSTSRNKIYETDIL